MIVFKVWHESEDPYTVQRKDIEHEIDAMEVGTEVTITKLELSEEELKNLPESGRY